MKKIIRKTMLWSHRWLGIVIGIHFVLLGLSGSYLVYTNEIEALLKKDLKVATTPIQPVNLEALVSSAKAGLGISTEPMRIILASSETNYNHEVMFNVPKGEEKRRFVRAYVDAGTGEYKGSAVFKETLTGFLFVFHHDLFSGGLGRTLVGVSGILCLAILLGGLYLWWPTKGKSFKRVLTYNKQKSFLGLNLELHKIVGFYSLILMIVVTFSGIYLAKPDWFFPRNGGPSGPGGGAPGLTINYQGLQKSAETLLKENRISQFRPDGKTGKIMALSRDRDHGISGWEWKADSGELLSTKYLQDRDFKKSFGDLQRDWHGGHFWGELGRFLIFLSGILPVFFYFTGFYVWFKKRSIRRERAAA